jgi:arginyl-tRNA synthetase
MQDYLKRKLRDVLDALDDDVPDDFEPELETPANPEHGDLSTNTAMRLPPHLKRPPREIASDLVGRLRERLDPERIRAVEVAGPGFVNFRFADDYLWNGLSQILAADDYGRTKAHSGQRALVEYVSANPTGPLTVGHGRNAVLGDTLANLLEWTGYEVEREYYFNDAGRQMRILAQSVRARYEAFADPDAPTRPIEEDGNIEEVPASFPEEGYRGQYIIDIARDLYDDDPDLLDADDLAPFRDAAEEAIFTEIEDTLNRLGIEMDRYFNERDLYDEGRVEAVLERLREVGVTYERDGATWLRTTDFGKDKDTVLVKSNGEPTYRLPDIAYHDDKFARGYDRIVDVFGADHVATYPDVLSALDVLGYDTDERVSVLVYQFVSLVRGGEPVTMSTRAANYTTLNELMDEVPSDVVRFFFLMRSPNTHLDFDLELARERNEKNPVFYLQYAHARISSILDKAEEVGFDYNAEPELERLTHDAEKALIKELLKLPDEIASAADMMAPHHLADYLRDVATAFTAFYGDCHIIGEERPLAVARMHLALAARTVLANGLAVLGISAPRSM